jgi:hypothetical protein
MTGILLQGCATFGDELIQFKHRSSLLLRWRPSGGHPRFVPKVYSIGERKVINPRRKTCPVGFPRKISNAPKSA